MEAQTPTIPPVDEYPDHYDADSYEAKLAAYDASNDQLFRWLDREFAHDFKTQESLLEREYAYNALDCRLGQRLEIPIVIPLPGDVIDFAFSSTSEDGEVCWGVFFITAGEEEEKEEQEKGAKGAEGAKKAKDGDKQEDNEDEEEDDKNVHTLREVAVCDCDKLHSTAYGRLQIGGDSGGTLVFIFENMNTDFFGATVGKSLSYAITVSSQAFPLVDQERAATSLAMLRQDAAALEALEGQLDEYEDQIDNSEEAFDDLEADFARLMEDLTAKKRQFNGALAEAKSAQAEAVNNFNLFKGLFFRALPSKVIGVIVSFVPQEGASICKFWRACLPGLPQAPQRRAAARTRPLTTPKARPHKASDSVKVKSLAEAHARGASQAYSQASQSGPLKAAAPKDQPAKGEAQRPAKTIHTPTPASAPAPARRNKQKIQNARIIKPDPQPLPPPHPNQPRIDRLHSERRKVKRLLEAAGSAPHIHTHEEKNELLQRFAALSQELRLLMQE